MIIGSEECTVHPYTDVLRGIGNRKLVFIRINQFQENSSIMRWPVDFSIQTDISNQHGFKFSADTVSETETCKSLR